MRLWLGHLPDVGGPEGLDLLVTIDEDQRPSMTNPDGTVITAAVRPGHEQRWLRWSPPVPLKPEDVWAVLAREEVDET